MKFCIPIPCFFKDLKFTEAIRRVKELGFDAIEAYDWKGLDFAEVKEALTECNVEFLSMCTSEFNMTDPKKRDAWLFGLEESCAAANKMGVKRLITQVGSDTGAPRERQRESILSALELAKPILIGHDITLMIEPLNTYVDHMGYYLYSSKEAFSIIRESAHPKIKLVYDIYHQQIMEGNIIPSVTQNLDCIEHLHAAAHPGRIEPWLGESDYKNIFAAIDDAGYRGFCGLEYNPTLPREESLLRFKEIYEK